MVICNGKPMLEGIDKIKVMLHPCLKYCIRFREHIHPKNYLTLHKTTYRIPEYQKEITRFIYLSIHAEYIRPNINIICNIVNAIYELIEKGILVIHDYYWKKVYYQYLQEQYGGTLISKKEDVAAVFNTTTIYNYTSVIDKDFIYKYLHFFVYAVKELEFFFDFSIDSIAIVPFSSPNEVLYKNIRIINDEEIPMYTTLYSNDCKYVKGTHTMRRKSVLSCYNRTYHLCKQNQISYEQLINYPYPLRLEFRLNKNNYDYLGLKYLDGTYDEIIEKYIPLLAVIYRKYFQKIMQVTSPEHPHFNTIQALTQIPRKRYKGVLEKYSIQQKKHRLEIIEMYKKSYPYKSADVIQDEINKYYSKENRIGRYKHDYALLLHELNKYLKHTGKKLPCFYYG